MTLEVYRTWPDGEDEILQHRWSDSREATLIRERLDARRAANPKCEYNYRLIRSKPVAGQIYGVWVKSQGRWAAPSAARAEVQIANGGRDDVVEFEVIDDAIAYADILKRKYPAEQFTPLPFVRHEMNKAPVLNEEQVAERKKYWKERKEIENGK